MQVLSPSPSLDREQHQQNQQPDYHPAPSPAAPQDQMPTQPSRFEPGAVAEAEAVTAGFSYLWSYEEEAEQQRMTEEQMVDGFYDDAHQYYVQHRYPYYHPEAYAARVGLYGAMNDPQWQPQMPQILQNCDESLGSYGWGARDCHTQVGQQQLEIACADPSSPAKANTKTTTPAPTSPSTPAVLLAHRPYQSLLRDAAAAQVPAYDPSAPPSFADLYESNSDADMMMTTAMTTMYDRGGSPHAPFTCSISEDLGREDEHADASPAVTTAASPLEYQVFQRMHTIRGYINEMFVPLGRESINTGGQSSEFCRIARAIAPISGSGFVKRHQDLTLMLVDIRIVLRQLQENYREGPDIPFTSSTAMTLPESPFGKVFRYLAERIQECRAQQSMESLYYLMYNKGFSAEVYRTKGLMYNYSRCTYLPKWQRPVVPGCSVALFFTHGLDLLQTLFDRISQFLSTHEQGSVQTYLICGFAVLEFLENVNDALFILRVKQRVHIQQLPVEAPLDALVPLDLESPSSHRASTSASSISNSDSSSSSSNSK